jgi:TonB family protein
VVAVSCEETVKHIYRAILRSSGHPAFFPSFMQGLLGFRILHASCTRFFFFFSNGDCMKSFCVSQVQAAFRMSKIAAAMVCMGAAGVTGGALAQSASGTSLEKAPSARAKLDSEKVFSWTRIQFSDRKQADGAKEPAKDEGKMVLRVAAKSAPAKAAPKPTEDNDAKAQAMADTLNANPTAAGVAAAAGVLAAGLAAPAAAAAAASQVPVPQAEPEYETITLSPVHVPQPDFPESLMLRLGKGRVEVSFDIQPDGKVTDVQVLNTSNARLNTFVLAAVNQWRFAPIAKEQTARIELGFDAEE